MIEKSVKKNTRQFNTKLFLAFVLMAVVAANVKSIFSDFGIDLEYAIVTSYRNLIGDRMFAEMREPHQTSSFLCTILMWGYLKVVGNSTGIVVFLQFCGVVIHFLVAFSLYRLLRKKTDSTLAALMCLCFATIYPKDFVFPEFSNMQIWFSVLMYIALMKYLETQSKIYFLLISGVCLSLTVLAYPSCVILLFVVIGLLIGYSEKKVKDCLLFAGTCAVCGLGYVSYFVARLGLNGFVEGIRNIITSDTSHAAGYGDSVYFVFFKEGIVWLVGCLLLSLMGSGILLLINKLVKRNCRPGRLFCSMLGVVLWISDICKVVAESDRFTYIILWPVLIFVSLFGLKYCSEEEKHLVIPGMWISLGCFTSTMLLTNLDLMSIIKYTSLALVLAFVPLSKLLERMYPCKEKIISWWIIICFGIIIIFRRGFIVKTMDGLPSSILDIPEFVQVQEGPAKGIVSNYMGAGVANLEIREWMQYIQAGDRVMILGSEAVSNLAYMYGDVEICVPSTISTPTYDETLLEYWEEYPEKRPNVITVMCNGDVVDIPNEPWLRTWLEEQLEGSSCNQGMYRLYYHLK